MVWFGLPVGDGDEAGVDEVHSVYPTTAGTLLSIGPGYHTEPHRFPRPDRFTVPTTSVPTIAARHVLVVDDTWVSGDKAQSAALALKPLAPPAGCATTDAITNKSSTTSSSPATQGVAP